MSSQPALAVYPVISGIVSSLFILGFCVPLYVGGYFDMILQTEPATGTSAMFDAGMYQSLPWQWWVVTVFLGFTFILVTSYCNAAFTTAILIRLSGSDVTAGEAFSIAAARFPAILGYSLIGATFGLVLRIIEERVGFLDRLLGILGGLAWAVVTFMVVPVLVVENVGPITGIKRGMTLLRQTWGEGLVGKVGIGAASGLLCFVILIAGAMAIALAVMTHVVALIVLAVAGTVFALLVVGVFSRTLSGIFTAALYAFATGRGLMPGIPTDSIVGAFGPKGKAVR